MEPTGRINFIYLLENHDRLRGMVLQGGTRSKKTVDTCLFIAWYLHEYTGKVVTIGRDKLTTLKKTLLLDWRKFTSPLDIPMYNKSDMTLTYNGNLVRFVGLNDDLMAAHGLTQDIFWINEAMSVSLDTFDQLEQRTSDFFILDYNPSGYNSWIYTLDKRDDVEFFKSTILDNPFAPEASIKKVMSYEPTPKNILLGTDDKFKWEVYGLGIRSQSEETVYKKWDYFDELPETYDLKVLGLDFGYTNHPAALIECVMDGNNLYLTELFYETGMLNKDIAERLPDFLDGNTHIVADSAEPKSVDELRSLGMDVMAAEKGQGSVNWGIDRMKSWKIHINKKSVNLQTEFTNYKFKKDKISGVILNDVIKEYDHLLDAARYAVTKFYPQLL